MTIAAIDPGSTGAIAILDGEGSHIDHMIIPTIKVGSKNRVNGAAVAAFLAQHEVEHCYIEQVGAMPGGGQRRMGASSAFSFGHATGLVEGVVVGAGIPVTLVTPQRWKKHAGLIGTDKDAARGRAVQLYPGLRVLDTKIKGQAVADALLIGRYGLSLAGNGSVS